MELLLQEVIATIEDYKKKANWSRTEGMNEKNKKRNIEEEVNYEDKKKYNNVGLTKCFIIGT